MAKNFHSDGLATQIPLLNETEVLRYRQFIVNFIRQNSANPQYADWIYFKPHIILKWLSDLARNTVVLDYVEAILGSDLLLWSSFIPVKLPHSSGQFGWHQDATYWPIEPVENTVTVWLALDEVTEENGCMRMIPCSHQLGQLEHEMTFDPHSMLKRGQQINCGINTDNQINIILKSGEASFHGPLTIHGSGCNNSDQWRLAVGLNYAANTVSPASGYADTALLVRGDAGNSRFHLENAPIADLHPDAIAHRNWAITLGSKRYHDVC